MTTQKPLLLLDVDGVLNRFWGMTAPKTDDAYSVTARGFPLLIPMSARKNVARLLEKFEPVWATAWESHAHPAFRAYLNLSNTPWPVIKFRRGWVTDGDEFATSRPLTWKLKDIMEFANANPERPLVWIDDDLHEDAYEWAETRTREGVKTLLIQPNPATGLSNRLTDLALRSF